jgi:predicted permease
MPQRPHAFGRAVLGRIYRVMLLAYPREFRRRVGADMEEVFVDLCRHEIRARGGRGLPALAARTLRDVVRNAFAERFRTPPALQPPSPRKPSRLPRDPIPAKGDNPMSMIAQDLGYSLRTLRQQPLFSVTVVFVLALGIAGTTGIFSIFNGLFLRPLPFEQPDRLVNLDETAPQWNLEFVSINFADFEAWREHNRAFAAMAVFDTETINLSLDGEASRVDVALASADIFDVLRVAPVIGRNFTAAEDAVGAEGVVMLSQALWRDRFAGDPGVLGRTLMLDSEAHTVIGVLPPEAMFIPGDVWVPLRTAVTENSGSWWLSGIGRMNPGVTIEQARADLERVHRAMIDERPVNEVTSPVVLPVLERLIGDLRLGTMALLGGVGVVLLIACANVAGLMLARATGRTREVGIRVALGAGRGRIVQQQLTESLLLAGTGALLGTVAGHLGVETALAVAPDNVPQWVSLEIDLRFLLFTVGITTLAALLFGFAPAWNAARTDPQRALQATGRSTPGSRRRWGLNALVVGEIALALLLLVCAGLLVSTVWRLQDVDPGFRTENVLSYRISLPSATYDTEPEQLAFFEQHVAEVRALPGVQEAGAVTHAPLGSHTGYFFTAEGGEPRGEDEPNPVTLTRWATIDYFRAIGVNLLAGRVFTTADAAEEAVPVAIVNQTFADYHWPGADPIGKRITTNPEDPDWITVVGLTQDVKHYGLDTDMRPGVYLPFERSPSANMTIVLRTTVDPLSLTDEARSLVRTRDPDLPIYNVRTMEQAIADSLWARRAGSWTLTVFAGAALLLAVSGIYGVVSFAVGERTHEIGIRMALGARRLQVLRQVVWQGGLLVGCGAAIGLVAAVIAASAVSSLLFGVSATEPAVYVGVTCLLLFIALIANLIPARRAASIEPVEALRRD